MRKASIILLSGAMILVMAAGSALARGGSAYVTSDCTYESLQDNTIEQGDLVYVWIKLTGDNTSVGEWSTVDNSGSIWQSGALILDGCVRNDSKGNPKYVLYLADGFNSSVLGSYTLTAWQGDALDSQVISGDAFRVVAAPV